MITGLASDSAVKKYLERAQHLSFFKECDGIPLFRGEVGLFCGGFKSFYTLFPESDQQSVDNFVSKLQKEYSSFHLLISVPFECKGARLANYVLETRTISGIENRLDFYEKKTRNLVKKSYKNAFQLKISRGMPGDDFYNLYNESVERLGGIVKEKSWFNVLEKNLGNQVVVLSLFDGGKMIASNYCVCSGEYILLMFNVSDPTYWNYAVNDRLYDELIKWSLENNLAFVDFGPSVLSDDSHNHFKAGFGAKRWYILDRHYGGLWYRFKAFLGGKRHALRLLWRKGLIGGGFDLFRRKRVIRFIFSGAIGAVVNLTLLFICTDFFHFHYLFSGVIAFVCATCTSFILQKKVTFNDSGREDVHKKFVLFVGTALINLVLNIFLLFIFVEWIHIYYIFAQVLAMLVVALWSYFIYKILIFKKVPLTL